MKILHLIDNLGAGGPTRSLLVFLKHALAGAVDFQHTIVSLQTNAYPPLLFAIRKLNVPVLRTPPNEELSRQIADADVVLVHFWNTPAMWACLTAERPAARYVLWSQVLGSHPPQMLSSSLLRQAAAVVLTSGESPVPPDLAEDVTVVPGLADFSRLEGIRPEPHAGFNVDYIGTTNTGKMHPGFVQMMERANIQGMTVRIFGGQPEGAIGDAIAASANNARFRTPGFVEDIGSILRTSDVFGYPLAGTTYATSDISLQEAMYAGIPPVVLPHGGPARFVSDGKTGIVARNEDEFVSALEYLYRNPQIRLELGRNAAAYAREAFAPAAPVARLIAAIRAAVSRPRTTLMPEFSSSTTGDACEAERFLVSQGWEPAEAFDAVAAWKRGSDRQLDRFIAGLSDEAFRVEGGVLHWRNAVPSNAAFRLWTAIWLVRQGRNADARNEARSARDLGAPLAACRLVEEITEDGITDARREALRGELGLVSS